ncbi:hypothetical protein D3C81_1166840 [compost metagenome]
MGGRRGAQCCGAECCGSEEGREGSLHGLRLHPGSLWVVVAEWPVPVFFVDFCDVLGSGIDLHRRGVKAALDGQSRAPGLLIAGVGKGNSGHQMSYDIVPYRKITSQDIGRDISQHATLERGVSFARTTGRGQTFRHRRRDAFVGAGTMHESLGAIDGFAMIHVRSRFPGD